MLILVISEQSLSRCGAQVLRYFAYIFSVRRGRWRCLAKSEVKGWTWVPYGNVFGFIMLINSRADM